MLNTVSVRMAAPTRVPKSMPMNVMTGIMALRSTCLRCHRALGEALGPRGAHVVGRVDSSIVVRVRRATTTVDTDASTIAGCTRYWNWSSVGMTPEVPLVGPEALHREAAHSGQSCW